MLVSFAQNAQQIVGLERELIVTSPIEVRRECLLPCDPPLALQDMASFHCERVFYRPADHGPTPPLQDAEACIGSSRRQ